MPNQQYDTDEWVKVFTAVFNQIIERRQVEKWQKDTNEDVKKKLQSIISITKRFILTDHENRYSLESCKLQCIEAGFNPGTDFNPYMVTLRLNQHMI